MGETTGFLKWKREGPTRRPVAAQVHDWEEVYTQFPRTSLMAQAGRCMDCGIPFCNSGCPLGNIIPDWNDLVYRDHWREAIERLHATNNFPEFTGRLCPAPCEASCVLGINQDPVTIKQVELEIVDRAWNEGWIEPVMPTVRTGKRVAVVGSGPAGLAAAQQLTRAGRELGGIHQAMEYLPIGNHVQEGDLPEPTITAAGKRVVIIGGGDTGADCLGTVHRQGALSVHQFEILPRPPDSRAPTNPWPTWSNVFRVSSAHEEGGDRVYSVNTERFVGDEHGNVRALVAHQVEFVNGRFEKVEGTDFDLPCELVLLAMGFVGPEREGLIEQLGVELDQRGNVARDASYMTSVPGVFACGDMGRGQSLIVWAIAEGRACAAYVDQLLAGETLLPVPVAPSARPLM